MEILSSRILVRPRDWELSRAFYAETLGLAVAREFPGGVVFFLGTGYLELSKAGAVAIGDDALWLQVRSLPDAVAELRGRGVTITREPRPRAVGPRRVLDRRPRRPRDRPRRDPARPPDPDRPPLRERSSRL